MDEPDQVTDSSFSLSAFWSGVPELIESMMYHDIVFQNGEMVHWGKMILNQLKNTMTKVGEWGRGEL